MRKRPWVAALAVAVLVVFAVALVACGEASTATTATPATTASPATTAATTAAQSTTSAAAATPADLFAQFCWGCHKKAPHASASQAETFVTNGKGRMPSFADKMTAEQIKTLAGWVAGQ